jgi:hypothetical protein
MRVLLLAALSLVASCEMPPKQKSGGDGSGARTESRRDSHHRHAVRIADLNTPDTVTSARPQHGVIVHTWGIATDILIVVDFDSSTVRVKRDEDMLEKPIHDDQTTKLDSAKLTAVQTAAFAAWHEDASGPTPQATDIREDLIVIDGDEGFYLSGYPISASIPEIKTGRPAAAKAMDAIYALSP